jgi:two-component system, response regulator YesN
MLRVLIVDENRVLRETFKTELVKHLPFLSVQEAIDGKEAIDKINLLHPSLIFMDICLPGVNGLQLTQKIKKDFPNIKVAILTGYDLPEYRQAAIHNGADWFFVKGSSNLDEIKTFVRDLFEV